MKKPCTPDVGVKLGTAQGCKAELLWGPSLVRLLGAIKTKKANRQIVTCPTQVVLPLSSNHGLFGNDSLYSISKTSLEMLFKPLVLQTLGWISLPYRHLWGKFVVTGQICNSELPFSWSHGTSLMGQSNMVVQEVEMRHYA